MKLLEKVIYSSILFIVIYVLFSIGLRLFNITSDYYSHMIGGVLATVSGVVLFMWLLIKR